MKPLLIEALDILEPARDRHVASAHSTGQDGFLDNQWHLYERCCGRITGHFSPIPIHGYASNLCDFEILSEVHELTESAITYTKVIYERRGHMLLSLSAS